MLQHPLDVAPNDELTEEPNNSVIAEEDNLMPQWHQSLPDLHSHDYVVRSSSPFGRRYLKPVHGIQTKGFARSAQRRSSVLTLGSIERLQHFYAKRDLQVNKVGTLGFKVVEEPDEFDDLPTPKAPPPSWIDLDVETDLDVLLEICFSDIQSTLTTWSMVTGPHLAHEAASDSDSDGSFQILPLLSSVTKMINAVKNYTLNRHDLSDTAMSKLRHASLNLLESMRELENQHRMEGDEEEDNRSEDGYIYRTSDFNMLEKERLAIDCYLETVEKYGFNPPHHIGSPPAVFTPEIKALMSRSSFLGGSSTSTAGSTDSGAAELDLVQKRAQSARAPGIPSWLERGSFVGDDMGRYYALLKDNRQSAFEADAGTAVLIPDPHEDEDAFLQSLVDGITLCNTYNNIVKRSRRPFGFINKVHQDTRRTYRAIENLRFFAAACKFRFDLQFEVFDPSEIARKTDRGLSMIKTALQVFCDCVIREMRENADMATKRSLPSHPPLEPTVYEYMEQQLFISQDEA